MSFEQATPANPVPGVNFNWTVPDGMSRFIVGVEYHLLCAAGGANRFPGLIIEIQGVPAHDFYLRYGHSIPPAAPHNVNWMVGITNTDAQPNVNNRENLGMICPLYLRPGDHIRSTVAALAGGDQISAIVIYSYRYFIT